MCEINGVGRCGCPGRGQDVCVDSCMSRYAWWWWWWWWWWWAMSKSPFTVPCECGLAPSLLGTGISSRSLALAHLRGGRAACEGRFAAAAAAAGGCLHRPALVAFARRELGFLIERAAVGPALVYHFLAGAGCVAVVLLLAAENLKKGESGASFDLQPINSRTNIMPRSDGAGATTRVRGGPGWHG